MLRRWRSAPAGKPETTGSDRLHAIRPGRMLVYCEHGKIRVVDWIGGQIELTQEDLRELLPLLVEIRHA